jgi:hypothetical protein
MRGKRREREVGNTSQSCIACYKKCIHAHIDTYMRACTHRNIHAYLQARMNRRSCTSILNAWRDATRASQSRITVLQKVYTLAVAAAVGKPFTAWRSTVCTLGRFNRLMARWVCIFCVYVCVYMCVWYVYA